MESFIIILMTLFSVGLCQPQINGDGKLSFVAKKSKHYKYKGIQLWPAKENMIITVETKTGKTFNDLICKKEEGTSWWWPAGGVKSLNKAMMNSFLKVAYTE
eukprot:115481_1